MAWIKMKGRKKLDIWLVQDAYRDEAAFDKWVTSYQEFSTRQAAQSSYNQAAFIGRQQSGAYSTEGTAFNWTHNIKVVLNDKLVGKKCEIGFIANTSARSYTTRTSYLTYNGSNHTASNVWTLQTASFTITNTTINLYNRAQGTSASWAPSIWTGYNYIHIYEE